MARSTIHRQWPSKGPLAIESFLNASTPHLACAESNDAVADFRELPDSLVRALSGAAGRIAASAVAQAQTDAETWQMFGQDLFDAAASQEFQASGSRDQGGPAPGGRQCAGVLDAAVWAVYLRLLLGQPFDAVWSQALSETVLRDCRANPTQADPTTRPSR